MVGSVEGASVGLCVVGVLDGDSVGFELGLLLGVVEGLSVAVAVGKLVGLSVFSNST